MVGLEVTASTRSRWSTRRSVLAPGKSDYVVTYSTACLLTPALASLRANCVYPTVRAGRRSVPPSPSPLPLSLSLSLSLSLFLVVREHSARGRLLIRESCKQRQAAKIPALASTPIIIIPRTFKAGSKPPPPLLRFPFTLLPLPLNIRPFGVFQLRVGQLALARLAFYGFI